MAAAFWFWELGAEAAVLVGGARQRDWEMAVGAHSTVLATRKRAAGTDAEGRGRDASVWSGFVLGVRCCGAQKPLHNLKFIRA